MWAAARPPGSRPGRGAEPPWPEGSTGQMLSRNSPARANFSRFSPPSQPLSPPNPPPSPSPRFGKGHPRHTPRSRGRSEHRAGRAASWSGGSPRVAGAELGARWGRGLRGPGRGGAGAAEVGGVCPRGRLAGGLSPAGKGGLALCGEPPRVAVPFFPEPTRAAAARCVAAAARGSRSWARCSGSPRGASREVSPGSQFPAGGGSCGTKPAALPLFRSVRASSFTSDRGGGGLHTWVSRVAPGTRLPGPPGECWGRHRRRTQPTRSTLGLETPRARGRVGGGVPLRFFCALKLR